MKRRTAMLLLSAVLLMGCTAPPTFTAPDGETRIRTDRCRFEAWVPRHEREEILTFRDDVREDAKPLVTDFIEAMQGLAQISGRGSAFDPDTAMKNDCGWGLYVSDSAQEYYYTVRNWNTDTYWTSRYYDWEEEPADEGQLCFATADLTSGRERCYEAPYGVSEAFQTLLLSALPEDAFVAARTVKGEASTPKSLPFLLVKEDHWWEDRSLYTLYDLSGNVLHYEEPEMVFDESVIFERMTAQYEQAQDFEEHAAPEEIVRAYIQAVQIPETLSMEVTFMGNDMGRTTLYLVRDAALLPVARYGDTLELPENEAARAMVALVEPMCGLTEE
ncbi:MAG: hypothetical protein IJ055_03310 [Oscillospiraceae bacterium]|nr:hypothetical protein [Oscillospiraceae bacterium]